MLDQSRQRLALTVKQMLFGRRGEPYRINGHTVRFEPGTRPVRRRYARSPNGVVRYDALQIGLLAGVLKEGDTAIDVGAHCGQYTLLMSALCGQSGRVVAFEPDPAARAGLWRNLSLNPSLKPPEVIEAAVADRAGTARLYSSGGKAQSSLVRAAVPASAVAPQSEFIVSVVSLDAFLESNACAAPSWIKIDVEGAEIDVLRGAVRTLAGTATVTCELHPYAWADTARSLASLKQLAAAAGRRIRYLDESSEIDRPRYGIALLERSA